MVLDSKNIQSQRFDWSLSVVKTLQRSMRILDVGCQTGEMCAMLKRLGHAAYGIDADPAVINQARQRYPDTSFELASAEDRLPYGAHEFDLVCAGDVIEHIRFTDVFVNELNRVLTVGGTLILTTPFHGRLKAALVAVVNFESHFDPEFPHYRFYTPRSLRGVLERRGFVVKSVSYIGRVRPIAQTMGVVAVKLADKSCWSSYRY